MYICDHDLITNFIVLYDGYPSNEQMEFLQVCTDISKSQLKLTDFDDLDHICMAKQARRNVFLVYIFEAVGDI